MTPFHAAIVAFEAAVRRTQATCLAAPAALWAARDGAEDSLAEIVEHMAISNRLFGKRMEAIVAQPARSAPYSAFEDGEIPHLFERADEPPGVAVPTGTWTDRDDAVRRFAESALPLLAFRDRDIGDVRLRGARHPLFGPMDALQWALFAGAHTERHRSQIIARLPPP